MMRFLIESLPVDPLLADEWVPAGVWVLSDEQDECVVRYAEDDPPSMEAAARASEIVQCGVVPFEPDDLQPAFSVQAYRIAGEVASSASEKVAFPPVVLGGQDCDACPSADNAVGGGGRGCGGTDRITQAAGPPSSGVEAIRGGKK